MARRIYVVLYKSLKKKTCLQTERKQNRERERDGSNSNPLLQPLQVPKTINNNNYLFSILKKYYK